MEEAFEWNSEGFGNEGVTSGEEDLVASLEEVEKLDAVLKMKLAEEKKAKFSRIQAEEESRDLLSSLLSSKMPDGVRTNVEQFMKLLNDVVEKEADSSPCLIVKGGDGMGEEEPGDGGEGTEGRRRCSFVQRNIRLARCGRGTLSLTDEEKSRIENLLRDMEDPGRKATFPREPAPENQEEFYAVDNETKTILCQIDERLEALAKWKTLKGRNGEADPIERGGNGLEENGRQSYAKGRKKGWEEGNRLEEINKLLNSMNSASDEEIIPLPEEELESLVEQSKEDAREEKCEDGGERPSPKLPQEVVAELVSGAKFLMPKFKYRFDES